MVFKLVQSILTRHKTVVAIVMCILTVISTCMAEQIVFTSFGTPIYGSFEYTPYGFDGEYPGIYLVKYDTTTHDFSGRAIPQTAMIYHGGNETPGIVWNASNSMVDKHTNHEYLIGRIKDDSIVVEPRFEPNEYGMWKILGWDDDGRTLYALCYDAVNSKLVVKLKRLGYSAKDEITYHVFQPNQLFTGMCFAYNESGKIAWMNKSPDGMQVVISNGQEKRRVTMKGGYYSAPLSWLDDNTLLYWDYLDEEFTQIVLMVYSWNTNETMPFATTTGNRVSIDNGWLPYYDMTISRGKDSIAFFIINTPGAKFPGADIAMISLNDGYTVLLHPWGDEFGDPGYRDINDGLRIEAPQNIGLENRIQLSIAYMD